MTGRSEEVQVIQPVVLCGGSGTRLWPLSRADRPKPFLPLLDERTLFQQTLDRLNEGGLFAEPLIVAGEKHVPLVEQQAGDYSLIVEPAARNTAPAIALAAARVEPDTILLVCPSDHHIADRQAFLEAVAKAQGLARDGKLVCFGIEPDRPETGYGYIEKGESLGEGHKVARFVEKPDEATAQAYLESGRFAWNSGMFVFRAGTFMDELARHRPEMAKAARQAVENGSEDGAQFHPESSAFTRINGESVDYALMENTAHAAIVSADIGWSDIGDWNSLMNAREAAGLDLLADGTRTIDADGVMTVGMDRRISVVGLDNVIVVVDGEDVLVLSRDAAQAVKNLATDKSE
ncbi:mannose-1-phosphate guanylyltransferase [Qipengyuania xiamenensis]|uniref:mannose-1-phosphate guanylyltransferase n=1 Tax=Qipengyuania xiamenensis TaxID=2867237 RepID=UPI0031F0B691